MGTYVITGADTLTINNKVLADFSDGDISAFTFDNDKWVLKTGKNGNTIYSLNEPGKNCKGVLRMMVGSSDDVYLQGLISAADQDPASVVLINGQFVKNLGDGAGNIVRDVYSLSGGIIVRNVDGKANVEGDTQQGVAVYNITFASATRSLE